MRTIVGLFDNFSDAQAVVRELESSGFERNDISVVANKGGNASSGATSTTGDKSSDVSTGSGAAIGAVSGGAIGAGAGLLAGLAGLFIPGLGHVLGVGPLAATIIGGTGIGAVSGGLMGALVSSGVPHEDAEYYTEGVRRGGTLVTVATSEARAQTAIDIMNRHNPVDIDDRAASWRKSGWSGGSPDVSGSTTMGDAAADRSTSPRSSTAASTTRNQPSQPAAGSARNTQNVQGKQAIPVVEEELAVGKRQVQTGGIRVYSRVEEKPVQEQVNLREEHARVERRPVDRPANEADFNRFKEGTIEVTETTEVPVVAKSARVVEEVVVGKDVQQHTETVRDTVRRTDVDVQQIPAGRQATGTRFETLEPDFRRNFQTSFPGGQQSWDQVSPAYRYGCELASDRGRQGDWNTIEPDARRRWEERSGQGTWDKVKNAARYAYDKVREKV